MFPMLKTVVLFLIIYVTYKVKHVLSYSQKHNFFNLNLG